MQNHNPRYPPPSAYHSAPSIAHHNANGLSARSRVLGHAPTLSRSMPLPHSRLSPLIDRDEPLPPVPFTRLDNNLELGERRFLPYQWLRGPHGPVPDELCNSATFPETREFRLVVHIGGREREVRLRPNRGANVVLVCDVVAAVERELELAADRRSGGLIFNGNSASRGSDGIWSWYGLAGRANVDDQGVWILYL